MSELDDPAQWRSAKDPKSGRTYWYHRVNRISTWIMPPFLVGEIVTSPAYTHDRREANGDNKTFTGVQIKMNISAMKRVNHRMSSDKLMELKT